MKHSFVSIALVLLAALALPVRSADDMSDVIANMYVYGTIDVSPQGNVTGYTLQQPGRLPPYVIKLLQKTIPAWHFKPTLFNGKPAAVKTSMTIKLVAHTTDEKTYTVGIGSTSFGAEDADHGYSVTIKGKLAKPVYPRIRGGSHGYVLVNAMVYVMARIDRQGRVAKSAVEEVDIGTWGTRDQLKDWRRQFSRAALDAAQAWRFNIPTRGRLAAMKTWDVIVRIEFRQGVWYKLDRNYGEWYSFIPGPFHPAPWVKSDGSPQDNSTIPANRGLYVVGAGLQRVSKPKGKS